MESCEEKMKSVVYFIEANSFEQHALWKEWVNPEMWNFWRSDWEEDSSGFWQQIGKISNHKNKPVCVSFNFAKLFGQRICFYNTTSRYVDHTMVEEWIKTNYPVKHDNNTRWSMTDTNNFHHAVHECLKLAKLNQKDRQKPVGYLIEELNSKIKKLGDK